MTKTQVGREGFISLHVLVPYRSLSSKAIRAGPHSEQEPGDMGVNVEAMERTDC